jgi:hypothetical protein
VNCGRVAVFGDARSDLLAALACGVLALAAFVVRRFDVQGSIRRCPQCAYFLIPPLPCLCPECGANFRTLHEVEIRRRMRKASVVPALFVLLGCLLGIPRVIEWSPLSVREEFRLEFEVPGTTLSVVAFGTASVAESGRRSLPTGDLTLTIVFVESEVGCSLVLEAAEGGWQLRDRDGRDSPNDAPRRSWWPDGNLAAPDSAARLEDVSEIVSSALAVVTQPAGNRPSVRSTQLTDERARVSRLLGAAFALAAAYLTWRASRLSDLKGVRA